MVSCSASVDHLERLAWSVAWLSRRMAGLCPCMQLRGPGPTPQGLRPDNSLHQLLWHGRDVNGHIAASSRVQCACDLSLAGLSRAMGEEGVEVLAGGYAAAADLKADKSASARHLRQEARLRCDQS